MPGYIPGCIPGCIIGYIPGYIPGAIGYGYYIPIGEAIGYYTMPGYNIIMGCIPTGYPMTG